MSRIGKKPISLPDKVEVTVLDNQVKVKGPKGELSMIVHPLVKVAKEEDGLVVTVAQPDIKMQASLWGLSRTLVNNLILGVTEGFSKQLEINGIGYKASVQSNKLILNVGYSHPVEFNLPEGIQANVEKNVITITGIDKQQVGQVAAEIRAIKKPEPYKGKGIKYIDEIIIRKAGKAVKGSES